MTPRLVDGVATWMMAPFTKKGKTGRRCLGGKAMGSFIVILTFLGCSKSWKHCV